jgi:hypothetical protein
MTSSLTYVMLGILAVPDCLLASLHMSVIVKLV